MMPYKLIYVALISLFLLLGSSQQSYATSNDESIFSDIAFWGRLSAFPEMQRAWENGAVIQKEVGRYGVFYAGSLFGFIANRIPTDNAGAQPKLTQAYIQRAEQKAVHTLGMFAFNDFDCSALAGFEKIQPDISQCKNIEISAKISSEWEMTAFSIIQASAESLCACKKALDKGLEDNNSFYGSLARAEIRWLYEEKKIDEVISFFNKNYTRKIFNKEELLIVAECFSKNQDVDSTTIILQAIVNHYSDTLSSYELERCGDIYYSLGMQEDASRLFELSASKLHE